jgi:hypothetical protein
MIAMSALRHDLAETWRSRNAQSPLQKFSMLTHPQTRPPAFRASFHRHFYAEDVHINAIYLHKRHGQPPLRPPSSTKLRPDLPKILHRIDIGCCVTGNDFHSSCAIEFFKPLTQLAAQFSVLYTIIHSRQLPACISLPPHLSYSHSATLS